MKCVLGGVALGAGLSLAASHFLPYPFVKKGAQGKNSAFVFIKPHAVTEKVKDCVSKGLKDQGLTIVSEGPISSEDIDKKKLIDQHYYSIASKATILKPKELNVPADKFEGQFGLTWQAALDSGKVYNAMDGCEKLGITADEMDAQWGICKKAKKLVKFGGGFYCGLIEMDGKESIYVFNGFFMSMRTKFTAPGLSIHYYLVEWDSSALSWEDFRGKVLGPTDPAEAPADSMRGIVMAQWKELGLAAEPNVGDNGVHASASPFEALAERMNWVGAKMENDAYGAALLGAGISKEWITAGCVDPQVPLEDGNKGSLFDAVEDMDSQACTAKLVALNALKEAPKEEEKEDKEAASWDLGAAKLARKAAEMPDHGMSAEELAAMRAKAKGNEMTAEQKKERGLLYDTSKASAVRDDSDEEDDGAADMAGGFDWE